MKDDGTSTNPVTATIARSDKLEVAISIPAEGSNLAWEFKTQAHDIGFSVSHENESGEKTEIVSYERCDCSKEQVNGSIERVKSGKYLLLFDNTFSYLRSKTVTYQVFIGSPVEPSLNEINNVGLESSVKSDSDNESKSDDEDEDDGRSDQEDN